MWDSLVSTPDDLLPPAFTSTHGVNAEKHRDIVRNTATSWLAPPQMDARQASVAQPGAQAALPKYKHFLQLHLQLFAVSLEGLRQRLEPGLQEGLPSADKDQMPVVQGITKSRELL